MDSAAEVVLWWGDARGRSCVGRSVLALVALVATAAGCGDDSDERSGREAQRPNALQHEPIRGDHTFPRVQAYEPQGPSPERRRLEQQARSAPRGPQQGCVKGRAFRGGQQRLVWAPPAPRIAQAQQVGRQVTVRFRFKQLPRAPGCRPSTIQATAVAGRRGTQSLRSSIGHFRVVGPSGSAAVRIAGTGRPHTVEVQVFTWDFRSSRVVTAPVM
jgi:hypothetical protein